jgi:type II secretion system protein E
MQPFEIPNGTIDPSVITKVPAKLATHYGIMPVDEKDGRLLIALAEAPTIELLDELNLMLGQELEIVQSTREDIAGAIKKYYGVGADTIERMISSDAVQIEILSEQKTKDEDIAQHAQDASVITFVNQILTEAIRDGATDIHIEPFEDELRIRYRIDGILYQTSIPPAIKHFQSAIVSRIKIMSDLNIAEKRLPQDGRIQVKMQGEEFDLRVSILPTTFGETVAIRILIRRNAFLSLEELGLSAQDMEKLVHLIKTPHGIILVTGPTGSGKTTTLYASLSRINSTDRKIITIEDPIEYRLKGIAQMQVLPQIGFSFANALRSMLRHDPNIMMVGEIRDLETAELTIRTALTGHLVFSTLHTNDAAGSVTRLLDMGIEPYLVSSSVEGIIAQRLVRLVCPHCKIPFLPDEEALCGIGLSKKDLANTALYVGKGCELCRYTGYRGRTGIYEIVILDDKLRSLILTRTQANTIKQAAVEQGMKTLHQDGCDKILKGLTTIEEVLRVTQEDEQGT